ncbi:hypothetical protein [Paractinoplanes lichenicola]|uniref:Uncharacterized protein n=1 Tax=Paractinoplanes lichenicola TaxID=2802976 RepID=A0ABS1VNW5_9ACTN|nr:hypothetical protein [Actinoplanes lichenicola]MBL7256323.1 hypothetical protein [Actinoplanes lichenicola]
MSPQFLLKRRTASRLAAIDAYRFPAAARQRVATANGSLTTSGLDQVEAAARQWFRLAARHPRAKTTMPSLITATLWHELADQSTEYAQFCTTAFGHVLPPPAPLPASPAAGTRGPAGVGGAVDLGAPSSGPAGWARAEVGGGPPGVPPSALAETFRLARQDENCAPGALPLLFRIDQQLAIPGGYRYLADCGGRGLCHDLPGTLCLMHLQGNGRLIRRRPPFGGPTHAGEGEIGPVCGAGCGSGSQ